MAAYMGGPDRAILVVEDEPELRSELVELLQLRGFAAYGTGDLASTRVWLEGSRTRFTVLSDLLLPDGSGSELMRYLQAGAEPNLALERLVLMTGHSDLPEELEQDLSDRAVQLLLKPVPFPQLMAALHQPPPEA